MEKIFMTLVQCTCTDDEIMQHLSNEERTFILKGTGSGTEWVCLSQPWGTPWMRLSDTLSANRPADRSLFLRLVTARVDL